MKTLRSPRLGGEKKDLEMKENELTKRIQPIHEAQLLTYLKLGGWTVGLLINFNVPVLKNGIKRIVNNYKEISAPSASLR